eukprot:1655576-Prorocentrum_lima.AAC.1
MERHTTAQKKRVIPIHMRAGAGFMDPMVGNGNGNGNSFALLFTRHSLLTVHMQWSLAPCVQSSSSFCSSGKH